MVFGLYDFSRDLHNNKLTGPIPPQIGRLKRLKVLYVPCDSFSETVSSFLQKHKFELRNYVTGLCYLYLSSCHAHVYRCLP